MEILIVISLFVLVWLNYMLYNGDYIAPAFVFSFAFLISVCDMVLNLNIWKTSLSVNTVLVVVGGVIVFSICTFVVHTFYTLLRSKRLVLQSLTEKRIPNYIRCKKWKLLLSILFQLICLVFVIKYVLSTTAKYGTDGSLSSAISMYQYLSKFTTLDMSFPLVITYSYILVSTSGYIWGYIILNNYCYYKKKNILVILNFIISFSSNFLTGSRGNSIQMLVALIVVYVCMMKQKRVSQVKNFKIIIKIFAIIICILFSFEFIAGLMGRDDSLGLFQYISVYLGAPIKNLDSFLEEYKKTSSIWGFNTFFMQIQWITSKMELNIPITAINVDMQYINGYNLGNVFTAFKSYISDFGYIGVVTCTGVMAIIIQVLYEKTKVIKMRTKYLKLNIDCTKLIYGHLFVAMAFSFFSNKFYEAFTITFAEKIFFWIVLAWFIEKDNIHNEITI
ncbi:O-antigen polymerase [Clostridium lundense]|uniref:O-antigen polymerase n=1 Tax=Clostridium lundense TaxID=319475 RepID=UPI00048A27B5|nr:O-antigen polymerase [Clostridium lundense]